MFHPQVSPRSHTLCGSSDSALRHWPQTSQTLAAACRPWPRWRPGPAERERFGCLWSQDVAYIHGDIQKKNFFGYSFWKVKG